jgi:hypothetical protein
MTADAQKYARLHAIRASLAAWLRARTTELMAELRRLNRADAPAAADDHNRSHSERVRAVKLAMAARGRNHNRCC